ncbi:MAG TPA: phosphoribosylformylglycinamidine cyclo-ligase [Firmicutes bacterium]|jgi:phosphoribosylformylglycinamidine cyclo-ligase|nr:phosphoribosylformylglycinamidine cyclo-ligase [Bacillota bacterium]HOQ24074.1 phosphoribosylformylglycinamidine cyclo-ligase [Bacillota bacterium]HPT67522.1 phosphoribosylformylglycinamidine cyclo-ligase [Bacillota bacterium]
MSFTYQNAGVNIDAGLETVQRIKQHVKSTYTPAVRGDLGSFGGLFAFPAGEYERPILVASTDGVGTKLKVAVAIGKHDSVGYDLVAHCINDILVQGAKPLFFLDYFGTGKLDPAVVEQVVKGMSLCCRENGCALIGGETAEMPGVYGMGDYDLVGTIVGVVDEGKILPRTGIKAGDLLFGLGSLGLHTNGYSLARKILEAHNIRYEEYREELGCTVGEALLANHRCYAPVLAKAMATGLVKGLAHITGGGFYDNIPRILPENCRALITNRNWPVPPIFTMLERLGELEAAECYRVFNMGIGMVCVVAAEDRESFIAALGDEPAYLLGHLAPGERGVEFL